MRVHTYLSTLLCVTAMCLGKQAPASPASPPPILKGLKIHEWGVFLAGAGQTQAGGGGEPPAFIQRIKLPSSASQPNAHPVKEPVLHIYAPEPLNLRVTVDFPPGGLPTLAWPPAEASQIEDPRMCLHVPGKPCWSRLAWDLQVGGAKEDLLRKVPENHWISAARAVGSDILAKRGRSDPQDAERFLFYEGNVPLQAQVRIRDLVHPGITVGACRFDSDGPTEAWCILWGGPPPFVFHATALVKNPSGKASELVQGCDEKPLDAQLTPALLQAGLSEAEAKALLTIWIPELTKPGTRLVYLLPRADYDRLLPITFDPAPEELHRVGLVIQEIP